jgi:hypothetical protein
MDDRFDQEFYRSAWRRVMPVGPHGIQPHLPTSGTARGLAAGLHGLVRLVGAVARGVGALKRWAALGITAPPMGTTAPRAQG